MAPHSTSVGTVHTTVDIRLGGRVHEYVRSGPNHHSGAQSPHVHPVYPDHLETRTRKAMTSGARQISMVAIVPIRIVKKANGAPARIQLMERLESMRREYVRGAVEQGCTRSRRVRGEALMSVLALHGAQLRTLLRESRPHSGQTVPGSPARSYPHVVQTPVGAFVRGPT